MTRFESPALQQPELHLTPVATRGLFWVAAAALTGLLWFGVGSQAGQFGDRDTAVHVTLEPVVISGHRLLPDNPGIAMAASGVACANTSSVMTVGSQKRVNLTQ